MNLNTVTVKSYFKGLIDLAIKLMTNPVDFFRAMPKTGGILDPMFYLVMTVLLDVTLISVESFVTHGVGVNDLGMLAGGLIIAPLIAVILSFFVVGIFFAIWSFMGSSENYETSYRCLAYTQIIVPVAILLSLVPYLGLLGIAWWLYLMVTATRVVHKVPVKPALLVYGIIAALIGLAYYNSVYSAIKAKEHLQEVTKKLHEMPDQRDIGKPRNR
ncbi:MAG: Yip1 family protein [Gallionella sp.]